MKLLEPCHCCQKIVSVGHATVLSKLPIYCHACLNSGKAKEHYEKDFNARLQQKQNAPIK